MLGAPSAWLAVLVLVLVLDLPPGFRRASRTVENEAENEDEKSRDGLPKIRGHTPEAPAVLTERLASC